MNSRWCQARAAARLFALAALIASAEALGFGRVGHALIADIAALHLTESAREGISVMLAEDLGANDRPSGATSLGHIASWADDIRNTAKGAGRGGWHFDNVAICGEPTITCPAEGCASGSIVKQFATLSDPTAPMLERNEALKWLVHLIGDIHQPLHAAQNNDLGGNKVAVAFFGRDTNLHSIWDTQMVERLVRERALTSELLASSISPAERLQWSRANVLEWVLESNQLARSVAYANLPQGFDCGGVPEGSIELGAAYYELAAPVLEMQIKKAGYRLAAILNAAFEDAELRHAATSTAPMRRVREAEATVSPQAPTRPMANFNAAKKVARDTIYSDNQVTFYCSCEYSPTGRSGGRIAAQGCGYKPRKNAARGKQLEWEHVVPASLIGRHRACWTRGHASCAKPGRACCAKVNKAFRQAEADLHNLVPAVGELNGDRSDLRYGIVPGEPRQYGRCDFEIGGGPPRVAEPRDEVRGLVARTWLYMAQTYGVKLSDAERAMYEEWRRAPVTEWERLRDTRVEAAQGNRNPFVTADQ